MNLQENIRRVLREETNRKTRIHKMIKDLGVEKTINMTGGFDRFIKKMDINDPMEFLNMFNDLDVVQSEENPNWTLFRYKKYENSMIYNRENDEVYIDYYRIWSVLSNNFGLNFDETQSLTETWLGEVYNLRGVTTYSDYLYQCA